MTTTLTREAAAYLDAVRAELADLSEEERADLMEDLTLHLAEVEAETAGAAPSERLGAPDVYARELRAAAGLPAKADAGAGAASSWTARARTLVADLMGRADVAEIRRSARTFAPLWWVVRGYLVVALPVWWSGNSYDDFPVPTVGGTHLLGVVVVGAAIAASTWVGRRSIRHPLLTAANAAVVAAAVVAVPQLSERVTPTYYVEHVPAANGYPLVSEAGPVTNIYAYSRDGQPLDDVLLFDQDGRPLRVAQQEWWPDGCVRIPQVAQAADGGPVDFLYPQRYVVAPGSGAYGQRCAVLPQRPPVPLPTFGAPPEESTTTTTASPASTASTAPEGSTSP